MNKKDLTGQRFGRLIVLKMVYGNVTKAECKCDCGNKIIVRQGNLTSGNTVSCGCFKKESAQVRNSTPIKNNSFLDKFPELCLDWSPKNKKTPDKYKPYSLAKIKWICHKCQYNWNNTICARALGNKCPHCNSIARTNPELLEEWDYIKNKNINPDEVACCSNKKYYWTCKKCKTDFKSSAYNRHIGTTCPKCSKIKSIEKRKIPNKGCSILDLRPDLVYELSKSNQVDLSKYKPNSITKLLWKCSKCKKEWESSIRNRYQGRNCPECSKIIAADKRKLPKSGKSLPEKFPDIAKEWSSKNRLGPENYNYGTRQKVYWKCSNCNHQWLASINTRTSHGTGCPKCKLSRGEKLIFNFLSINQINFQTQFKFDDCKHIFQLRFDFAIFNDINKLLLLIEFNGIQHYHTTGKKHFSSSKNLELIQKRDNIKIDYCKNNNIPLLVISYTDILNIEPILNHARKQYRF